MENETDQNLGYAGFFFKKILQPHSLRNESFKQAADFKDKNLIFYVNQKFKEIRQRIGTDNLPKTMFLQSILKTKSTKTDIHKILAQENIETRNEKQQKTNENLNKNKEIMISKRYEPTMNSVNRHIMVKLNDRKQKELFVYESEGIPKKTSKKIYESNPDRKVRAILHENISENALKETLSEFNKLRLKTKFQRLKNDKNFEKIDFNKKFRVINQIIHNEDDEIDNNYFMTEICQKNKIDLSSLMHIAPDKLKMLEETVEVARQLEISDSSLISSASKKKKPEQKSKFHHQKLSVNEIEEIIQKEEDNQEKNLIDIFKKTHEDPDEYRKAASNATTNKKLNFQDQLFQKMDDNNKLEFMKICKY